ncbi:MAG: hypothetical protein WCK03_04145 [Candidatus Taylorbacteria bacterium]
MNTKKSSKKTIIIIVVLIVASAIAYFYYESSNTVTNSGLETTAETTDAQAAGARVLSLLNQIKSIKIDTTVFKDPSYLSLRDYSVEIPQDNVGRSNPFAPLPGTASATTTPGTTVTPRR